MPAYRIKAYIYLLIVVAIWGIASPVIKFTLGGIDPLPFLAYRFAIASVFSLIFFAVKGIKIPSSDKIRELVFLYGFLAVPLALGALFVGLDKTTVLDLTLVGVIGPMIVTAGAAIFFRDHITKREKLGIAIVLSGIFLSELLPFMLGDSKAKLSGNLFLIVNLLADSSSILVAKKAVKDKVNSITLTNFAFLIGAIFIIPLAISLHGWGALTQVTQLPLKYHLGVWYMALISGTLAYFLYVRAQKSIEASEAVLFNYLQPVFTIPLAIFWLKEQLTYHFIIGAIIIAIGLTIAEYKKHKKRAN
jgi:drug/metabolite transporter (DMT)-like permease